MYATGVNCWQTILKNICRSSLLLLFFFSSTLSLVAQEAPISIKKENAKLIEILDEIEKKEGYTFLIRSSDVDLQAKKSINIVNKSLSFILSELFKGSDVSYKIEKKNVTIYVPNQSKDSEQSASLVEQDRFIEGVVVSEMNEPVIGATVALEGVTTGTFTDLDGKFSIKAPANGTLIISCIGYISQKIPLKGNSSLNIVLEEDTKILDEVVVVGYGTQKKSSLTGAVSVIKMSDISEANTSTGNAMKSLQGRIPGVQVISDGNPNGYATVRIRGTGTFGNNDPLYIIDGVPSKRNLNEISPADIESIQVLKDASAASIYGSRASAGVIIITTKKAKKGIEINFSTSVTIQKYRNPVELANTEQRGYMQWKAYRNDGLNPNSGVYSFEDHLNQQGQWVLDRIKLPEFINASKTMRPADTDWANVLARTGVTQNYNLSLANKSEKGHVYFALDYYDNAGTIKGSNFSRLSTRINSDYELFNGRVTVGENLAISKLSYRGNIDAGIINAARYIQPVIPVYTEDGGYGGPVSGMTDHMLNLVRIVDTNKDNGNDAVRILGSVFAKVDILKNLKFNTTLAIDYLGFWQRHLTLPYKEGFVTYDLSKVKNDANYSGNWSVNNTLTYNLNQNKHNAEIMVGQEAIAYQINSLMASKENFALYNAKYMYLDAGESNPQVAGSSQAHNLASFFGRFNYAYDNKYLFSGTLRRDGSSRFSRNNRWATFPAFSVGWRLTGESFVKDNFPFVSDFKLRYGWGQTGNQEIDSYASYSIYSSIYATDPGWLDSFSADQGTAYDIAGIGTGQLPSGYALQQPANPNIKWETSTQSNYGLDFGFLKQKITGSLDIYRKVTKDILVKPPVLAVLGENGSYWVNGATIKNTGIDLIVAYQDQINKVDFAVTANISKYKNIITRLPQGVEATFAGNGNNDIILNRKWGSIYGLVTDGIFQSKDEVNQHVDQPGKGVGRIRYKDVNEDGKIDNDDRTWIGCTDPDLLAGLNISVAWNNFDFSMFWRGMFGQDVINHTKRFTDFYAVDDPTENKGTRLLGAWSFENSSSSIPAISSRNDNGEDRLSSYYIEDGSFVRLDNAQLGYTLPNKLLKNKFIKSGRVYVMGQNLLLLKKSAYTAKDPEYPNSAYIVPRSFSFGLNLTF